MVKPYKFMGLYKLSSQFTDFIKARSANPEKILEQVSDAIEDLGDKGHILPGGAAALEAFHSYTPGKGDASDQDMFDYLGENAAPVINRMYRILGELVSTGKLDMVTRKVIETFLKSWTPYPEEKVQTGVPGVSGVIRRKKPEGQEPVEDVKLPEMETRNRWSSPEDRMIARLDRERVASSLYDLFTKAGVLEKLPDFEERKVRLAERSFEWAKIAQ